MEWETPALKYPFPWREFLPLGLDIVSGRPRSVSAAAGTLWRMVETPPRLVGLENIPIRGPVLVAMNHYQRRGVWITWPAGLVSLAVASRRNGAECCWVVTGGLRLAQWSDRGPVIPGSRRILERVARTYGMIPLPLAGSLSRGLAVRELLKRLERGEAVATFPEGLHGRSGRLEPALPGFERLIQMCVSRSVPILPAAAFEAEDRMWCRFGPVIGISGSTAMVMKSIAELLPSTIPVSHKDRVGSVG